MTTTSRPKTRESPTREFRFSWTDSFLWAVRVVAIFVIVWGCVGAIALGLEGNGLSADEWKRLIVGGLAQGSMYGLIALGYSMVYGVLGFINFAHGEVFMVGAMVAFFAADALERVGMWDSNFMISIIIVLIVAIATSTLTAILIEKIAYRPLRNAPRLIPLITSIGLSFFLQYSVLLLFGANPKSYPRAPARGRRDLESGPGAGLLDLVASAPGGLPARRDAGQPAQAPASDGASAACARVAAASRPQTLVEAARRAARNRYVRTLTLYPILPGVIDLDDIRRRRARDAGGGGPLANRWDSSLREEASSR